jgi:hypothetical protein
MPRNVASVPDSLQLAVRLPPPLLAALAMEPEPTRALVLARIAVREWEGR